ncbi:gamma carbonic anhydrase family protein [Enterococcus rivorum]|uniref:Gamma carbonic anhydrase family protein n=1 Tax=Enterococcus rivorum TaxID=762845 RepID=A0A1E5L0X2_9ENTE|nr:gamma carbonic anhydrase family protein [Enterococcus rivorum]MBP2098674.1 carbonic anhydrase/acetyltransferase-like protein (isoleucine patch superfamily) [Enterococcus rivorum]OEH83768.1 gamma carbonic anhydrase family protein [Enterococcus rivorum]
MKDYFIASSADVYGNVHLGKKSSIWFQAVLRGDNDSITIGDGSNIQDGTIIHTDKGMPVTIGNAVTVGHQCLLHGCTIENGALIGMGTTILNRAVIGENSLIGAGSLVTEGKIIPPNVLAFGRPAKVIRELTEEEIVANQKNAQHYTKLSKEHKAGIYQQIKGK